ncbi:MAG TPA: hypothetical protein VKM55_04110 [Candidatus Lokiarchaeia archaeon]|nr:hypothetical protein [Candidatus Lokiarchaeia archaeon]
MSGLLVLSSGFLLDMDLLSKLSPSFDLVRLPLVPVLFIIGTLIFFASSISGISTTMVDFYTNKHICIVHKGEIKGKMYICSKCNAFYCVQCKEAIESIDKCCWNCKAPFVTDNTEEAATLAPVEPSVESMVDEGKKYKIKKAS